MLNNLPLQLKEHVLSRELSGYLNPKSVPKSYFSLSLSIMNFYSMFISRLKFIIDNDWERLKLKKAIPWHIIASNAKLSYNILRIIEDADQTFYNKHIIVFLGLIRYICFEDKEPLDNFKLLKVELSKLDSQNSQVSYLTIEYLTDGKKYSLKMNLSGQVSLAITHLIMTYLKSSFDPIFNLDLNESEHLLDEVAIRYIDVIARFKDIKLDQYLSYDNQTIFLLNRARMKAGGSKNALIKALLPDYYFTSWLDNFVRDGNKRDLSRLFLILHALKISNLLICPETWQTILCTDTRLCAIGGHICITASGDAKSAIYRYLKEKPKARYIHLIESLEPYQYIRELHHDRKFV